MTMHSNACNDQRLLEILDADEDSVLDRDAAAHVDTCSSCQQRLTELSADTGHWFVQREMLQPVEGDVYGSGILSRYCLPEWAGWPSRSADESTLKELLSAPSHPEMLGRLGRYEIERVIGSGGMGIVLKAFDSELNRAVAIKVLAPHVARVGAARQRFAREARRGSRRRA